MSAVRLYFMYVMIKSNYRKSTRDQPRQLHSTQLTFIEDALIGVLCGIIESAIFVICSCLAVLRPLFARITDKIRTVDNSNCPELEQGTSLTASVTGNGRLYSSTTITPKSHSIYKVQDTNPLPNLDYQRKQKVQDSEAKLKTESSNSFDEKV
jgi:hypothetical protein